MSDSHVLMHYRGILGKAAYFKTITPSVWCVFFMQLFSVANIPVYSVFRYRLITLIGLRYMYVVAISYSWLIN